VSWLRVQKGWCAAQHPTHHFSFSPVLGQSCHFCLSLESAGNGERDTGERGKGEGERERARAITPHEREGLKLTIFVALGEDRVFFFFVDLFCRRGGRWERVFLFWRGVRSRPTASAQSAHKNYIKDHGRNTFSRLCSRVKEPSVYFHKHAGRGGVTTALGRSRRRSAIC
jgi:hypothetical protein